MKGVPLRLEVRPCEISFGLAASGLGQVGPKDMAQGTCRMVCRFDGSKKELRAASALRTVKWLRASRM